MTLTNETLDRWMADAKKATDGKWHAGFYDGMGSISSGYLIDGNYKPVCRSNYDVEYSKKHFNEDGDPLIENVEYRGPCLKRDAIHIENSQPQNFATLIEELKTLRAETHQVNYTYDMYKSLQRERDNLRAEIATLREHRNYASEFLSEKEKRERYESTIKEALEKWDTGFDVKHILQCALKGF